MIRAVIFDFNGVLVDDEHVHFELFREILAEEGVAISAEQYHERYLGLDDRGCFEAALRRGRPGGRRAAARRSDCAEGAAVRRGRRGGPAVLSRRGQLPDTLAGCWPLAINSGALRPEIEFALDRLDCRDRVAAIVSAEDTNQCKPDPQGYLLALEALRRHPGDGAALADLRPEHCLVVEDSLAGVASAKGAGMWAVGITHTYRAEALREAGADAIIDGLKTLTPDWITGRFSTVRV